MWTVKNNEGKYLSVTRQWVNDSTFALLFNWHKDVVKYIQMYGYDASAVRI